MAEHSGLYAFLVFVMLVMFARVRFGYRELKVNKLGSFGPVALRALGQHGPGLLVLGAWVIGPTRNQCTMTKIMRPIEI